MKSIVLLFISLGFAFGAQPRIWLNQTTRQGSENYIIKGSDAPDGKYPYMLSLNAFETNHHVCGAAILTRRWALTAAHCCPRADERRLTLYSGSNLLSEGGNFHDIHFYKRHEHYNPNQYWINDICLIRVKDEFEFGPKVQQITLPPQDWAVNDADQLTISGWGYTEPDGLYIPDKLQHAETLVALSRKNCSEKTEYDHESYLCAMGSKTGQGVCNGDSGSPLMKNGVVVGVASFVYIPCGGGMPDFYARVPIFVDWIKKTLGPDASELKFMK